MKAPASFDARYPTKRAVVAADAVVDQLSIHLPLSEHIRRWELAYAEAGGITRTR